VRTETKTVYISDDGREHGSKEEARKADFRAYLFAKFCEGLTPVQVIVARGLIEAILSDPAIHLNILRKDQRDLPLR